MNFLALFHKLKRLKIRHYHRSPLLKSVDYPVFVTTLEGCVLKLSKIARLALSASTGLAQKGLYT
jgi:hypothetical protein